MRIHWLWLSLLPQVTIVQKLKLLEHFPDAEQLYTANLNQLREIEGMTPQLLQLLNNKDLDQAHRLSERCDDAGINFLTYGDREYPAGLRSLPDAPIVLYYLGHLPNLEQRPMIGVVGTRAATKKGLEKSFRMGGEIAACGGIVVSGGAKGVDAEALRGAHSAGGATVTVLAGGLDRLYPKENQGLFQVLREKGCLVSEYTPGTGAYKGNFLRRNRLISGMSNGVLVVEAPEISGALNTARWAKEQGKEIFAIPGSAEQDAYAGNAGLLAEGAKPVETGWDLMQNYEERYPWHIKQRAFEPREVEIPVEEKKPKKPVCDKKGIDKQEKQPYSVIEQNLPPLNDQERQIVQMVYSREMTPDQLSEKLGVDSRAMLGILTMLSMKGVLQVGADNIIKLN